MKKILTNKSQPVIHISSLPKYPLVGAIEKHSRSKSFVVMTKYDDGSSYQLMAVNQFAKGNQYDSIEFRDTLSNILTLHTHEFYLFDNTSDLFSWLATDEAGDADWVD